MASYPVHCKEAFFSTLCVTVNGFRVGGDGLHFINHVEGIVVSQSIALSPVVLVEAGIEWSHSFIDPSYPLNTCLIPPILTVMLVAYHSSSPISPHFVN